MALASLDVLVHPGAHETCGHVLREAAASGLPVVAARSGGAPDVVRHLETGLLHDPSDPRGLADAVAALVADRHRALLGRRARDVVTRRTWEDAVDEPSPGTTRPPGPRAPPGRPENAAQPGICHTPHRAPCP